MNLVGYLRVSSTQQVEDGHGLEVQEQGIRDWCKREGHVIVAMHRDEGISGAKDEVDRPGLAGALAATEDVAEGLVVYRLDRLARDIIIQETIFAQLAKRDRRIFSTAESDLDGSNPTRVLVRQLLGIIAQYERALITIRLQSGRRLKADRGGYAYGSPRFGTRAEDRELVVDGEEQATIRRMAQLKAEGKSLKVIAAMLTLEGLRPKRADRWHSETVRRVLSRLEAA